MKTRALGKSDLTVSALGLGCMGMSEFYGPSDEAASIAVLHHAVDVGYTFFDTADMYGPFKNEELVGKAFGDRRDKVVIATKFAIMRSEDGSFGGISGKPEYVKQACEASLKRLGIDAIDLYYQHRVDPQTPIEDTVGAMAELVQQGKVRYLGLSEAAPETLRRACAVHPITALQTEYSLWSRDPEHEIFATCDELGIGFVAYSPLGRGFLSGQIKSIDDLAEDDYRRQTPRFIGDNFSKNLDLVAKVEALAAAKQCTPAQLALAWCMQNNPNVIPIPGTTKRTRIDENAGSLAVSLTAEEMREIDAIAPRGVAAGGRYDARGMSVVDG